MQVFIPTQTKLSVPLHTGTYNVSTRRSYVNRRTNRKTYLKQPGVILKTPNLLVREVTRSAASVAPLTKNTALVTTSGLNLVFISAEVTPWSKTGGLGDVIGGLPIELSRMGHKVMTVAPRSFFNFNNKNLN